MQTTGNALLYAHVKYPHSQLAVAQLAFHVPTASLSLNRPVPRDGIIVTDSYEVYRAYRNAGYSAYYLSPLRFYRTYLEILHRFEIIREKEDLLRPQLHYLLIPLFVDRSCDAVQFVMQKDRQLYEQLKQITYSAEVAVERSDISALVNSANFAYFAKLQYGPEDSEIRRTAVALSFYTQGEYVKVLPYAPLESECRGDPTLMVLALKELADYLNRPVLSYVLLNGIVTLLFVTPWTRPGEYSFIHEIARRISSRPVSDSCLTMSAIMRVDRISASLRKTLDELLMRVAGQIEAMLLAVQR